MVVRYVWCKINAGESTCGDFYTEKNNYVGKYIPEQLTGFAVDNNWTPANIVLERFNPMDETWDLVCDVSGGEIEFPITPTRTVVISSLDTVGINHCRIRSRSNEQDVIQLNDTIITVFCQRF